LNNARTIQVKASTKRKLDELGRKGDTYDKIISELVKFYEDKNCDARGKPTLEV